MKTIFRKSDDYEVILIPKGLIDKGTLSFEEIGRQVVELIIGGGEDEEDDGEN